MGGMIGLEGSGEELLGKHVKVVLDGQPPSLLVEVGDRGSFRAAGRCTKCRVLNSLKFLDVGRGGVGEPDGSGVMED